MRMARSRASFRLSFEKSIFGAMFTPGRGCGFGGSSANAGRRGLANASLAPFWVQGVGMASSTTGAVLFRREPRVARLHDPRREFTLSDVESEIRYDPLT